MLVIVFIIPNCFNLVGMTLAKVARSRDKYHYKTELELHNLSKTFVFVEEKVTWTWRCDEIVLYINKVFVYACMTI